MNVHKYGPKCINKFKDVSIHHLQSNSRIDFHNLLGSLTVYWQRLFFFNLEFKPKTKVGKKFTNHLCYAGFLSQMKENINDANIIVYMHILINI